MLLAAVNTAHDGGSILCTLLLIAAIILTILCIAALAGFGSWRRGPGVAYGPNHYGPVVGAVIAWVLYFVLC